MTSSVLSSSFSISSQYVASHFQLQEGQHYASLIYNLLQASLGPGLLGREGFAYIAWGIA